MQISEHFTLAELTRSSAAQRLKLDNTPDAQALARLQVLAQMLESIRLHLGAPIIVTSAYRALAVNRAVGGVTSSDHVRGQAADIVVPQYGTPLQVARSLVPVINQLSIGQLIYEHVGASQWVHVSTRIPDRPVNRVITVTNAGTQLGIQES